MKVQPKKNNSYKTIIKKDDLINKFTETRNAGIKIGGIIVCKVIRGILCNNDNNEGKIQKIIEFCNKTTDEKGENL